MLNVIGRKNIYFAVSAILIVASVVAIGLYGFKQGIDFRGGTLWQLAVKENAPTPTALQNAIVEMTSADVRVNQTEQGGFLVRLPVLDETNHQSYLEALKKKYPSLEELSFSSIGPSVGAELRRKAIMAIILVLLGISLYIAYAFRKASYPVSSWKYGWVTLVTLFHDVIIPAGLLAYLGHTQGVEIDGNFVVALLVVMGFSVHDTIVVFDRIRENVVLRGHKERFETVVNDSINQTLARSVNTSLTLILVLIALYFMGPETLRFFVLTLLIGVSAGIYSSIFIASPLLVVFKGKRA
ncbi:MAG: protein translocase subunit SecF [Candidatus Liptonbacteria bacterium]|nr:protein translocase subunit SecF [Candidatus Liptonbacteria bacterium]